MISSTALLEGAHTMIFVLRGDSLQPPWHSSFHSRSNSLRTIEIIPITVVVLPVPGGPYRRKMSCSFILTTFFIASSCCLLYSFLTFSSIYYRVGELAKDAAVSVLLWSNLFGSMRKGANS